MGVANFVWHGVAAFIILSICLAWTRRKYEAQEMRETLLPLWLGIVPERRRNVTLLRALKFLEVSVAKIAQLKIEIKRPPVALLNLESVLPFVTIWILLLKDSEDSHNSFLNDYFGNVAQMQGVHFYDGAGNNFDLKKIICILAGKNDEKFKKMIFSFENEGGSGRWYVKVSI